MTKQELISTIQPSSTYVGSAIIKMIKETIFYNEIEILKRGDVLSLHDGVKKRPFVITKVFEDSVIALPLSKSEGIHI